MRLQANTIRKIGSTGVEVTALGLGSAPLGGLYAELPTQHAIEVLEAGWQAGIRYFDTAPMYGLGRAEHLMGQVLRETSRPFTLSTKVGRLMVRQNVAWFDGDLPDGLWRDLEQARGAGQ